MLLCLLLMCYPLNACVYVRMYGTPESNAKHLRCELLGTVPQPSYLNGWRSGHFADINIGGEVNYSDGPSGYTTYPWY